MEAKFEDYYVILGVKENADLEEIKRAYKRLCKAYHPDEGAEDDTMFKKLREIYVTLNDPQKKAEYDRKRKAYQASGGRTENEAFHSKKQESAVREGLYRKAEELRNMRTEIAFGAAAVLYGCIAEWKDAASKAAECLKAERDLRTLRLEEAERTRAKMEELDRKVCEYEKAADEKGKLAEDLDKELQKANGQLHKLKRKTVIFGALYSVLCVLLAVLIAGGADLNGKEEPYEAIAADTREVKDSTFPGDSTRHYIVTADSGVNMRRAEDRRDIVGVLPAGTQIATSMEYEADGWVRFKWNGIDVVVYERYLHRTDMP